MPKNRICELLGIRYPIIQAPMNWVSGAELVAAVSNAGGLGTLGPNAGADKITSDVELTGERARDQIRRVRSLTNRPFAVNIPVGFADDVKFSRRMVQVVIQEKVPVIIVSVGPPNVYTQELQAVGIKVLHAISTVRHAKTAEEAGVDAVICEGFEAGGHKGFTELTTLALTPLVSDAVKIPIVSGGGIADARGVVAALALGADAAYLGTRFMATHESESHPHVKKALIESMDACTTSVPKSHMLARDLINEFTREYVEQQRAGATAEALSAYLRSHSQYHAQRLGNAHEAEICCGQGAALVNEIKAAGDVMSDIVSDISRRIDDLILKLDGIR